MPRLRALLDRQVAGLRIVDLAATAACLTAMLVELLGYDDDIDHGTPIAVVAVVVACLPVLLRGRAPATAGALAMTTMFGVLTTTGIYQTIAGPAVLCAYSLARRHGRGAALVAAVVTVPVVVMILHVYSPHRFLNWDTARNVSLVLLPLALGVSAHDRRTATAALLERAETAERTREEETLRRVGEERLRIARDVHDVVAHAMVAINVQAGVGAHLLARDADAAHASLLDIKRVSGEALADLRATLGVLRTGDVEQAPVRPTESMLSCDGLDDLGASLRASGVEVEVDVSTTTLPAAVDAAGYRIVQEALTNVLRHGATTRAAVRVRRDGDRVVIDVENDGEGRPVAPAVAGSGNGLRGMRERVQAVGGTFEAGPVADGGWRVHASLPLVGAGTPG